MHFRVRKNVVQLIRTNYDEIKKKGVNTIIGTVKLINPEISSDLRQNLTTVEIADFEAWVETHHRTAMLREEVVALTLAETIDVAEKWFEREGNSVAAQMAARDIVFHWQALRRVFANNGLLD